MSALLPQLLTMNVLTQDRLKVYLDYDMGTGIFTWKVSASPRAVVGATAGCINSRGYIVIGLGGKLYLAHRLAHLYVTGVFPPHVMDHVNRVPTDNRWVNLRVCEQVNNRSNSKAKANRRYKNVVWDKSRQKWFVGIMYRGKSHFVGRFTDQDEAALAYNAKAQELFGEFAYLNPVG